MLRDQPINTTHSAQVLVRKVYFHRLHFIIVKVRNTIKMNEKSVFIFPIGLDNAFSPIKIKAAGPNGSYSSFPDKITAENAAFKLKGPIRCSI